MKIPKQQTLKYIASTTGLAMLNYLGASLGKLIAIPPGNVTPVWPPSGIAFAVLLVFGYRLWPGVWLGSFLFNVLFFYQEHHFLTLPVIACSMGIACGSTIQALLGVILARRLTGFSISEWRLSGFFNALLIGGPFACLIGATVGSGSLALSGMIPWQAYMNTWTTWWFGDSVGVLVLGGFIISSVYQLKNKTLPSTSSYKINWIRLFSVLCLLIFIGRVLSLWQFIRNEVYLDNVEHFEKLTDDAAFNLRARLSSYKYALRSARGFIQASNNVEKGEWKTYVESLDIERQYPGLLGIGYIANIPRAQLSTYLPKAQRQYGVNLHTVGASSRQYKDLFITQLIEPLAINRSALGLDIGSESNRRLTAELSRDTGHSRITAPLQLVQNQKKEPGFLILLPVYRLDLPVNTIQGRRKALQGWVYSPLIGRQILSGIAKSPEITFAVYDRVIDSRNLIYSETEKNNVQTTHSIFRRVTPIVFGERKWLVVWESTSDFRFSSDSNQPFYILLFGLFAILLLAFLLLNLNVSRERAFKMVNAAYKKIEERNSLLQEANAALEKELLERQRIEKNLREISRRERLILHTMNEGIFGFDANGKVRFINRSAASMLGSSIEEIMAMPQTHSVFHHTKVDGSPCPQEECAILLAAREGVYKKVDCDLFWKKDGSSFPVEYAVTPVFQDNVLEGVVVVFRDITERLTHEKLLREASRRFEAIFNQSFQFIGLLSPEGILLEANQSALEAAGISNNEVIGRFFWETPWWSHSIALQKQLKEAIEKARQNEFIRFEATHQTPDGNTITVDFSLKPMLDEHGDVVLLIPEGRDITHIKKIEEEHRAMVEKLREVARLKRTFVSTLTHDLRTPLIAQKRVLHSLQNEKVISQDERLNGLIKGFWQNNTDLLQMVNNLLATYELEDGRIKPLPEPIDLYQMALDCCLELQEVLDAKEIVVENRIKMDFPKIEADGLLVKRLFHNLLGNSIANIPHGSRICLDVEDWDTCVDISVQDNGPGIAQELMPHLFTRFLSGASTRKKIGSGLGLYICKMICELHGGTIRVDSTPESGTTVSFTLPKESPCHDVE